jgi:ankyrin repeat protein
MLKLRFAAALLLLALSACDASPEGAREKLARRGIQFTFTEFVRRAGSDPWSTLELFLRGGMDPNVKGDADPKLEGVTALMVASRSGRGDVVRRLRDAGAGVDIQTRAGNTALMYASAGCSPQTVQVLLLSEADVNHANHHGETALAWAIPSNWEGDTPACAVDCINQLILAGARLDDKARDGATPVHTAISRGQLSVLRLFLRRGADPNLRGGQLDVSPLQHAVRQDQVDMVKTLLREGADATEPHLLEWPNQTGQGQMIREMLSQAIGHQMYLKTMSAQAAANREAAGGKIVPQSFVVSDR